MKKNIILLCLLFKISISLGQSNTDTIGHYANGIIHSNEPPYEHKKYQYKTMFYRVKFPSGNIHKEFVRYNDTAFLYTEYYDITDSFWRKHIYREGLVSRSNYVSGDTIEGNNMETYEPLLFLDTLLLPIHIWVYRHPYGDSMAVGSYKNYKKQGQWRYFDEREREGKTVTFDEGVQTSVNYKNIVLTEDNEQIRNALQGIWTTSGISIYKVKFKSSCDNRLLIYEKIASEASVSLSRFNNTINFLNFAGTKLIATERKKGEKEALTIRDYAISEKKTGSYSVNGNLLQINLDGNVENFEIIYVSAEHIILKLK
jgi:hypothetical protein